MNSMTCKVHLLQVTLGKTREVCHAMGAEPVVCAKTPSASTGKTAGFCVAAETDIPFFTSTVGSGGSSARESMDRAKR
jgi:hypothetical protein